MILDKQIIDNKKELINYLLNQTGGDTELSNDLYQDLFIKVRKILLNGKYSEEGKSINWLKIVSKNLVIDHYRKASKMKLISPRDELNIFNTMIIEDEPYQDTFVTDEMSVKLDKAIKSLPEQQQELIYMRYYRNMTYKEIVKETGEKQSNLLPRMHYAIKKLQKQLR